MFFFPERAVFTKSIVTPVLGISGVGGAMAVYGAADVVVSKTKMTHLLNDLLYPSFSQIMLTDILHSLYHLFILSCCFHCFRQ